MDARITRLEHAVERLRDSAAQHASDARAVRRGTDSAHASLEQRIDQLETRLTALRETRLNTSIFVVHIVIYAMLLGTMAAGFGWVGNG